MTAVVAFTPEFQPWIVPSSVTNKKTAGWPGALGILTPFPGMPPGALSATIVTGTSTGGGVCPEGLAGFKPELLYSVEVPPALFEIHQGVAGPWTSPHAFCRLGSVTEAAGVTGTLDTRFVC